MKYKILFSDWEGELTFEDSSNPKYFIVDKKEAKKFMNNCPLISVNENSSKN